MSRGRREEFREKKLNIKKVILVISIILVIVAGIIVATNKDKIFKPKEDYAFESNIEPEKTEKTIEDILAEFGGEVIDTPKSDTYYVSKEGKTYTIYADGDIVEEQINFWSGKSSKPAIDEVGNINIYSAEELKWVADQVINGENNFSGVTITLRKDLDFGARIKEDGSWEGPIWTSIIGFLDELPKEEDKDKEKDKDKEEAEDPNAENLKRFNGCFNGNGFSIRGIYIDSDKNYQGLFGYSTGTIQNVELNNSYISGRYGTGAIVGLNAGVIENCIIKNTIVNGKDSKVGGICGISMSSSTIKHSHTDKGQIKGNSYVGGIVGYVNNNVIIEECSNAAKVAGQDYAGGIAGIIYYGTTVSSTDNSETVSGKNYVGGIAGYSQAQMEKVYNTAEVNGEDFVAGLAGVNFTMGDISKSYNTGNINGNNNIGGIVGTNNSSISNTYNKGNIKSKGYRAGGICGQNATESFIYNAYNIGKIEGEESIDGVVGGDFGTITNCYYLDTVLPDMQSEYSKTEEELKNNSLENLGEEFTSDEKQINDGYPIFSWQK